MIIVIEITATSVFTVSYTHLDVYKRQPLHLSKVSFTKRNIAFDIYKYRIIRLFDTISCILTIFDEMR